MRKRVIAIHSNNKELVKVNIDLLLQLKQLKEEKDNLQRQILFDNKPNCVS